MKQELIKTTDEVNRLLTLAGSFELVDFLPSFRQGIRFVSRYTGDKIIDIALAHYNSESYTDIFTGDSKEDKAELDKLVILIQQAAIVWGFYKYAPLGNVIVNSSGIQVTWHDRMRPANDWQLDRMADALRDLAFENIDELLQFLYVYGEKLGVETEVKLLRVKNLFINSAEEFNPFYDIGYSPRFFFELTPIIAEIERRYVLPILKLRFGELKERIRNIDVSKPETQLTETEKQILDAVRIPLAKMSVYEASTRLKRELFVDSLYSKVIGTTERTQASPSILYNEADAGFKALEKLIKSLNAPIETNSTAIKSYCSKHKGFRL